MPPREQNQRAGDWRTKPTDRFILHWIKVHLSARITPALHRLPWLEPHHLTVCSAALGAVAGIVYAAGHAWQAGCVAAIAQVLDGVDGQLARRRGTTSRAGAFWDSVLDRYADGAPLTGSAIYVVRTEAGVSWWLIAAVAALALIGTNLISYSTARAEALGIDLGAPTRVSKGTRSVVLILGAWGTLLWTRLPAVVLLYLAVHTNVEIIRRLRRARASASTSAGGRP